VFTVCECGLQSWAEGQGCRFSRDESTSLILGGTRLCALVGRRYRHGSGEEGRRQYHYGKGNAHVQCCAVTIRSL
jgi:hypothetical protein